MTAEENLQRVEDKIRLKIEDVFEQGMFLNDGQVLGIDCDGTQDLHDVELGCCVLGAVLFGEGKYESVHGDAGRLLGIDRNDARALELGYMSETSIPVGSDQHPFYVLGRRLRADYCGSIE
jgi:hypothetical protein